MENRKQPSDETIETRCIQYRADVTPDSRIVTGYAALYNSEIRLYGDLYEIVAPGAFTNAMAKSDIRLLYNHDANIVMGRNKSGTLKISEDQIGMSFSCELPMSRADVLESMQRGDVDQCSYAFRIKNEHWEERADGTTLRTILELEELFDVSIVTYPADKKTKANIVSKSAQAEYEKRSASRHTPEPTTPPAPDTTTQDSKSKYILRQRRLAFGSIN